MPRKADPDRTTRQVTIEVPDPIHERLLTEATARGVTLRWLVARLVVEAAATLRPAEEFTLTGIAPPIDPAPAVPPAE